MGNKVSELRVFAGNGTETAPLLGVLEGISISCSIHSSWWSDWTTYRFILQGRILQTTCLQTTWFPFSLKNKKKKSFAEEKHQMHPFNYLQYLLSYNLYVFFFSCPRDYVDLIKIERCLGGIRSCACGFLRGYWKRSDDSFQDRGRLPVEEWGSLVFM